MFTGAFHVKTNSWNTKAGISSIPTNNPHTSHEGHVTEISQKTRQVKTEQKQNTNEGPNPTKFSSYN